MRQPVQQLRQYEQRPRVATLFSQADVMVGSLSVTALNPRSGGATLYSVLSSQQRP